MEMRSKRELGVAGRRFWKNHCKDFGLREMEAGEPLASASIRTEYLGEAARGGGHISRTIVLAVQGRKASKRSVLALSNVASQR